MYILNFELFIVAKQISKLKLSQMVLFCSSWLCFDSHRLILKYVVTIDISWEAKVVRIILYISNNY